MKGLSAAHNPTNVGEIQYFNGTALILLMLTQLCMDCVLIIIIHLQFSCIEEAAQKTLQLEKAGKSFSLLQM